MEQMKEIDLRIFRESLKRKFICFVRGYSKCEVRLGMELEKLLFYMEAAGDRVS